MAFVEQRTWLWPTGRRLGKQGHKPVVSGTSSRHVKGPKAEEGLCEGAHQVGIYEMEGKLERISIMVVRYTSILGGPTGKVTRHHHHLFPTLHDCRP